MIAHLIEVFKYRDLLFNLTRRDLKVKYRGSILGFFWSLLNPILMTLVYSFVFSKVIRAGIEDFAVFFISVLLPWNLLANSVNGGVTSVVGNAALIRKIYFPREILPLSVIFANLINFLLELLALFVFLLIKGYRFYLMLYLLPVALVIELVLVIGITLVVASLNVFFRDIQHLVGVLMMVWFFGTPIIYPLSMVPQEFHLLMILNPMTVLAILYRNIFYNVNYPDLLQFPSALTIGISVGMSLFLCVLGYWLFNRLEPRFAEEV